MMPTCRVINLCVGETRVSLAIHSPAFQSEHAGKLVPPIDDLTYTCLIDVRGMQLFSTTQILWGERSNCTVKVDLKQEALYVYCRFTIHILLNARAVYFS